MESDGSGAAAPSALEWVPTVEELLRSMVELSETSRELPAGLRHDLVMAFGLGPMEFDVVALLSVDLRARPMVKCSMRSSSRLGTDAQPLYGQIARKLRQLADELEAEPARATVIVVDDPEPPKDPAS